MSERINTMIVGVLALSLALAAYMAYLGKVNEAKEIAIMVVSGLVGAIGGHHAAKLARNPEVAQDVANAAQEAANEVKL